MDQSQDPSGNEPAPAPRDGERPTLHNLARVIRSSLAEYRPDAASPSESGSQDASPPQAGPRPAAREARPEKAEANFGADFAATMESVRRVSESLRAAEQRSSDLQAGLQALTDRARREIGLAEERARAAKERAEAAEARAQQAEERLAQMMELIQREFAAALSGHGDKSASAA